MKAGSGCIISSNIYESWNIRTDAFEAREKKFCNSFSDGKILFCYMKQVYLVIDYY